MEEIVKKCGPLGPRQHQVVAIRRGSIRPIQRRPLKPHPKPDDNLHNVDNIAWSE